MSTAGSQNRARVFLCHSTTDKPAVRALYRRLVDDGFAPWLDEENLTAGENWEHAIRKAMRAADYVVACLSNAATTNAGYVHKEIKQALDIADEQPEGSIYVIPVRLEACTVPDRLSHVHWVDLYAENGYVRLTEALSSKVGSHQPHPELEPEQIELLRRVAQAALSVPRSERRFLFTQTFGGNHLEGPGGRVEVELDDVEQLVRYGYLREVQRGSNSSQVVVTSEGLKFAGQAAVSPSTALPTLWVDDPDTQLSPNIGGDAQDVDRTAHLNSALDAMPFPDGTRAAICLIARPAARAFDLVAAAANGADADEVIRGLRQTAVGVDPYPDQGDASISDAYQLTRRGADIWVLRGGHPADSDYVTVLEVHRSGLLHYWAKPLGRVEESERFVVLERSVTRHADQFTAVAAELYARAGVVGPVDIGVVVTGIEHAVGASTGRSFDRRAYGAPDYRRERRVTAIELLEERPAVVRSMLVDLFEVISRPSYDPFDDRR